MSPRLRSVLRHVAAALAGFVACAVQAATVDVVVRTPTGQPVPDVVVQLITPHPVAFTPGVTTIAAQQDDRFMPYVTAVPVGSVVRFVNHDAYDHYLRSQPVGPLGAVAPAKTFELHLGPDTTAELTFDKPGIVPLGCNQHSATHGHLFVSETPLVAVTDANGHATIADVPDGPLELRSWHPEQLVEQAALARPVNGAAARFDLVLNFTPQRPRSRRG